MPVEHTLGAALIEPTHGVGLGPRFDIFHVRDFSRRSSRRRNGILLVPEYGPSPLGSSSLRLP